MTSHLEQEFAHYHDWRDQMIAGIESYKAWLDVNVNADIQQSLRIYDLIETLRNDRMTLAFLADFSRGKTELINAMFFSDFKQRLLPSNVGRTTMCPTEIFHDDTEEPYIRLLPIETRVRQETVAALKRQHVEWIKIRLNIESAEEMLTAMQHLVEVKTVTPEGARALGLWDETNPAVQPGDKIEIPAWRHAMISYPHALLKNGLVVLDTPGLNALGTEPELTLSMIPNAHAVLFLLAIDTGVTKSDLDTWQKYVQTGGTRRVAVLNKVDLMWDELKSDAAIAQDVERQIVQASGLLNLPRTHVVALSAQKALVARIRGDQTLLAKSGIEQLEELLAREFIPAKQEIMREAVRSEIGSMLEVSRLAVMEQVGAIQTELKELATMSGKNRGLAQVMVARLENDRKTYEETVQAFRATSAAVTAQGATLLDQLGEERIEQVLNTDRKFIEDAWTTAGLWKNMQALFLHFTAVSTNILNFSNQIKTLVDTSYMLFHEKFGFARLTPPALNLEKHTLNMTSLQETAREFCQDPVNVAMYKNVVVNRFYETLVAKARQVFEMTRLDAESWLKSALNPLNSQIKEHESILSKRIDNFKKIRDNITSVEDRMKDLEKQRVTLQQQGQVLVGINSNLDSGAADGARPQAAPKTAQVT